MQSATLLRLIHLEGFDPEGMSEEYQEKVADATLGLVSDEELFALLSDKRVARVIEGRFNSASAGGSIAERVDVFVAFLREKLTADTSVEGLSDEWVVKSFGFNLFTGKRQDGRTISPQIRENLGRLNLRAIG